MPHTPGPWKIEGINADGKIGVGAPPEIRGGSGALICMCGSDYADNSANARLIAAAPDLLAALEDFMLVNAGGEYEFESNEPRVYRMMHKAICKARGI